MVDEFNIIEKEFSDHVEMTIIGEIDIYNVHKFKKRFYEIIDNKKMDIKIDCKGLNYIDSTGLGMFVGVLKKVKEHDKNVYLLNLKENIKKLFYITGLEKLFVIE